MRKSEKKLKYLVMAMDTTTLDNKWLGQFYELNVAMFFARRVKGEQDNLILSIWHLSKGYPTRAVKVDRQIRPL